MLVPIALAGTALLLVGDRQQRVSAWLFIAAAALWGIGNLGIYDFGPFPLLQYLVGPLIFPAVGAVLLQYPEPQVRLRVERLFIAGSATALVTTHLVSALCSVPSAHNFDNGAWWPTVAVLPAVWANFSTIYFYCAIASAVGFLGLVVARYRRAAGLDRRLLAPVTVATATGATVTTAEAAIRILPHSREITTTVFSIEAGALLIIPAAFLVSAIRRWLARGAVADLVVALARTPVDVRDALRASVSDPTLEVDYWIAERGEYVNASRVRADEPGTDRLAKDVRSISGDRLARITADVSLSRYSAIVDAAIAAAGLALENTRLHEAVAIQLDEVRESRRRIVSAGDEERRRLERELHDRLQGRLVALNTGLMKVEARAVTAAERDRVRASIADLQGALAELSDIVHGIHPVELTDFGLRTAINLIAERTRLPVSVEVPERRWDPLVERTIFAVVNEAVTNVLKHAGARRIAVSVTVEGSTLVLLISDDGAGGAELKAGGGLQGLRDRVEAVGGKIEVASPPTGGTSVRAQVPVAT